MTASLLVFVPVALLALVGTVCFVGCALIYTYGDYKAAPDDPEKPDKPDKPDYRKDDVLADEPACFWPLDDGPVTAKEAINGVNGTYQDKNSRANLFPCPDIPGTSAVAPGDLTTGAPAIIATDPTACMQTDGGFVAVPNDPACNPSEPFTVEVWVTPEFDEAVAANRQVIDGRNQAGTDLSGYGIRISDTGVWQGQLGLANTPAFFVFTAVTATLNKPAHVVLTLDVNGDAALWVNGEKTPASLPAGAAFAANKSGPLVFGVGAPYLPDRPAGAIEPPLQFFPAFPFKGRIQDVAVYAKVLDDATIKKHFDDGTNNT